MMILKSILLTALLMEFSPTEHPSQNCNDVASRSGCAGLRSAALVVGPENQESLSQNSAIAITPNFDLEQPLKPDQQIELVLSRPLRKAEERLGVIIGTTDVSSLFKLEKLRLRYDPTLWPLPTGQSELTVYLITKDDEWKEIGRFGLVVDDGKTHPRTGLAQRDNFEANFIRAAFTGRFRDTPPAVPQEPDKPEKKKGKINFTPSLNFGLKSQPAQSTFPTADTPERATFGDFTMQATLRSEASYGRFSSQSSADLAGSSFRQEALRFGDLGVLAPKVDLASYVLQFQTGPVKYQVGHFSFGTQRHLINSFSSRGITVTVPFLKNRFDFSAAAMNGTQLVGYDNFFGLSKRRHQMLSGTLGIEMFPKRPGGLRVEIGLLSAYFQPLAGINRGVVTDLQRSRGLSLRLIANDKSGRFHFEGGFTRSFFVSPSDVTLNQGESVVPLPALARNAHYFEVSYQILKNFALSTTRRANLTVAFKEENVAPLFRSLGASAQADKIQYEFSANGSVDEITGQFSYVNFHDNLRNIPSILRTLNGSMNLSIAAPAKVLFGRTKDAAWLPRLGYSFNRLHAFGAAIPVNGGFEVDPSSIPNLFGTNHSFSAEWQIKKVTVVYNLNRSLQDNEQTGHERADQSVLVNTGRVGIAVNTKLSLNLDLTRESSGNRETERVDRTYRLGPGISWQLTKSMGLSASLSNTIAGDAANTSRSRNTEFDASWTYRFGAGKEGLKKMSGQFFLRYSNRYSHSLDRVFATDSLRKNQALTANLSFTFF